MWACDERIQGVGRRRKEAERFKKKNEEHEKEKT